MKHLLTIQEVKHIRENKVIWQAENLKNVLHKQGEEFMLSALFKTTLASVPSFYYLGLDNRSLLQLTDQISSSLSGEPTSNGYTRQPVSSASGFLLEEVSGIYRATSLVVSFSATGGSWGPVQNIFITDRIDNLGYLIATAPLGSSRTVNSGDIFTLKFGLSLRDYP
jgi:hypothetical protein